VSKSDYTKGKRNPVTHRTYEQVVAMDKGYNREHMDGIVARVKARRMMMREGKVEPFDGKDVDHKKPLRHGGTTTRSNLRVVPASRNRGWADGKI
jgi:hypothetical protein